MGVPEPDGEPDPAVDDSTQGVGSSPAGDVRGQRGEPSTLGRYLLRRPLGAGAMGAVYEAHDVTLGRTVAIKVLHHELSERDRQRLHREALALARLSHPNVVHIYEIGREHQRNFIAMEYVRGRTLDGWQRGRPSWRECVRVYLQAGQGLAAAHAEGLVHRDFKPSNCILGEDGRVRVVDFGLACVADTEHASELDRGDGLVEGFTESLDVRLTRTGAVLGTLAYMPIEQISGAPATRQSDQFSFCASLYEALYGVRPFGGRALGQLTLALATGKIEPAPKGSRVPARLRRVLLRGLSTEPDDRWPSMDDLLAVLSRVAHRRRSGAAVLVALGGAAGVAVGAMIFTEAEVDPCLRVEAAIEATWGGERAAALAEAFHGWGDARVTAAWPGVRAQLDDYAQAWGAMAEESCRATFVHHQQSEQAFDQRIQCLERRRNRLRSAVDALLEADSAQALLERTVVAFQLPGLQSCGDLEAVAAAPPLPQEPQMRARVARLRARVDEADTRWEAGDFERGITVAKEAVADARAVGYLPLLAEALASLGRLQLMGASANDAEQTLREAIMVAAEAGDLRTEAEAWTHLLLGYLLLGRVEVGEQQELAARAAVARAHDAVVHGWLLNNLGALYSERGDPVRSRELLREALEVKRRTLGADHVDVGISWYNLGNALADHHAYSEARDAFEQALAIYGATLGPVHPLCQYAQAGLCRVELAEGRAEAAVALCGEALRYIETTTQSPSWESKVALTLAQAQWATGRHDLARRTAERALLRSESALEKQVISRWLENPEADPWEQADATARANETDGARPADADPTPSG